MILLSLFPTSFNVSRETSEIVSNSEIPVFSLFLGTFLSISDFSDVKSYDKSLDLAKFSLFSLSESSMISRVVLDFISYEFDIDFNKAVSK